MSQSSNKCLVSDSKVLWVIFIVFYALLLNYLKGQLPELSFIRFCVISSLLLLIIQVKKIAALAQSWITPCTIYLGLYYVFQNGLLLLSLFDTEYNSFYLDYFQLYIKEATMYASISNLIAGFACYLVYRNIKPKKIKNKLDSISDAVIADRAFVGFVFTGLVAIPLIVLKTMVALQGGYEAVRLYEGNIPFVFNLLEYLFIPFVILSLLYISGSKQKIILLFAIIWLLLTSFCGDRTTGLSGLLIISILYYKKESNSKNNIKSFVKLGLVLLLLVFFVQLFGVLRTQGTVSSMGEKENAFVHFLGELGFSSITLFAMMDIVPSSEAFLNGTGYLASFISGFLPASLDPTGLVDYLVQYRDVNDLWMQKYFDFGFGLGFSLNSEAYINLGWYGFLPLFFINYIVFFFLNYSNRRTNATKFDLYVTFILLFLWCTLPRRDSYYIWKALMYGVILIRWYILLTSLKTRKHGAS